MAYANSSSEGNVVSGNSMYCNEIPIYEAGGLITNAPSITEANNSLIEGTSRT
ncbi:MAG: hypothetical protein R2771_14320 [Saprospiraceae bacterium]